MISHLIVPKQHGGADYCNMDNEEEICEYSDQRELLTLGWIHVSIEQLTVSVVISLIARSSLIDEAYLDFISVDGE